MDGMRSDVDGNLYITSHGKGTVVLCRRQAKCFGKLMFSAETLQISALEAPTAAPLM